MVKKIKEKVIGTEVEKQLKKTDAFINIVHEELIDLMGKDESSIEFKKKPTKILLCGLQGSGKTTTCAKLARYIRLEQKKSVSLVALDLKRPAAIKQLQILGAKVEVPVFAVEDELDPSVVAEKSSKIDTDVIIYDTAGRQGFR